jgi:hypothetical protein
VLIGLLDFEKGPKGIRQAKSLGLGKSAFWAHPSFKSGLTLPLHYVNLTVIYFATQQLSIDSPFPTIILYVFVAVAGIVQSS